MSDFSDMWGSVKQSLGGKKGSPEGRARDRYAEELKRQLAGLYDPETGKAKFADLKDIYDQELGFIDTQFGNMFGEANKTANRKMYEMSQTADKMIGKSNFAGSGILDEFSRRAKDMLSVDYSSSISNIYNKRELERLGAFKDFSEKKGSLEAKFNQMIAELIGTSSKYAPKSFEGFQDWYSKEY